ncbi:MAG TPA: trypsin-like peptidase domain-containing protein [Longimicrobiaceae bacterium]|nr:trypsin-like peptidase domain-containing protein [Longimicrobiaceae bacterium]
MSTFSRRTPRLLALSLLLAPAVASCARSAAKPVEDQAPAAQLEKPPLRDTLPLATAQEQVSSARQNAIVLAARRVSPAVVSVNTRVRERVQPRTLWEQMMLPPGATQESAGLGSGIIVQSNGIVITNEHVVHGATQIVVTLPDGRDFDADVVGTDALTDLAVLRLRLPAGKKVSLPTAPLGNSDNLLVGEWAVAIGNPLGFYLANTEPTVTVGVISGTGRNIIPSSDDRGYYLDMIQTDASINPGNSGGPLVNALGQVIGVNSSILSTTGGSEGLGFAIPINRARRVVKDLLAHGRVLHAWLGVEVEPLQQGDLHRAADVRITRVVPGSPGDRAGLKAGMVIRAVDGRRVLTPLDWQAALLRAEIGQPMDVEVVSGNGTRDYRATPTDLPSESAQRVQALKDFQLITLTPGVRAERNISSQQGAVIVGLSDTARQLGFQEGDVILQINRVRIHSAEEAAQALQQVAGRGGVIYFERGGQVGVVQF